MGHRSTTQQCESRAATIDLSVEPRILTPMTRAHAHAHDLSGRDDPHADGADAGSVADSAVALASVDPSEALTVAQVVERTGWSAATVKRKARALGGSLTRDGWRFPALHLERRVETMRVTLGPERQRGRDDHEVGPRAARVLAMLEDGSRTSAQIAIALEESPEFVLRVRMQWELLAQADQRRVQRCGCGATAHAATARCLPCHARSQVLSDEQLAVLAGREAPPPQSCTCTGCGATVDTTTSDHACRTCAASRVDVVVRGGALVVTLGDRVMRSLSIERTSDVAQQLAHHVRPAAPVFAVPEAARR